MSKDLSTTQTPSRRVARNVLQILESGEKVQYRAHIVGADASLSELQPEFLSSHPYVTHTLDPNERIFLLSTDVPRLYGYQDLNDQDNLEQRLMFSISPLETTHCARQQFSTKNASLPIYDTKDDGITWAVEDIKRSAETAYHKRMCEQLLSKKIEDYRHQSLKILSVPSLDNNRSMYSQFIQWLDEGSYRIVVHNGGDSSKRQHYSEIIIKNKTPVSATYEVFDPDNEKKGGGGDIALRAQFLLADRLPAATMDVYHLTEKDLLKQDIFQNKSILAHYLDWERTKDETGRLRKQKP